MPRKKNQVSSKPSADLAQYLDEMVQPTLDEFEANPTSRRRAFLACVAIAHAVDYSERRREDLKRQSKEFRLVDQVAHAFKHEQSSLHQSEVIVRPQLFMGRRFGVFLAWTTRRAA